MKPYVKDALRSIMHGNFGSAYKIIATSARENNPCSLPHFDNDLYNQILNHPVSLVCESCWGGRMLHMLGLRFDSPFVNVRVGLERKDFFEMLENLTELMRTSPSTQPAFRWRNVDFIGWEGRTIFPILWYGDIMIHGFHYSNQISMKEAWERRRARFHFDNVAVVKILYDKSDVERFERLQFEKKVAFAPFESDYSDIITIPYPDNNAIEPYAYNYMTRVWNALVSREVFNKMDMFKFLAGYKSFKLKG